MKTHLNSMYKYTVYIYIYMIYIYIGGLMGEIYIYIYIPKCCNLQLMDSLSLFLYSCIESGSLYKKYSSLSSSFYIRGILYGNMDIWLYILKNMRNHFFFFSNFFFYFSLFFLLLLLIYAYLKNIYISEIYLALFYKLKVKIHIFPRVFFSLKDALQ